jgi:ubiquinone/menaquinone biosynthesis C-methylase UbiE
VPAWKAVKEYYDARAPEYDEWYLGLGKFAARERPGWHDAVRGLQDAVSSLPPASTLDVACGTGFLTRHLAGKVTGLDQSEAMLDIARQRVPNGRFLQGDAAALPFEDDEFDRLCTGHFYGHLEPGVREAFLSDARRVAGELVVVDSAWAGPSRFWGAHARVEWQERELNDGSSYQVYKRYFDPEELAGELGGGTVLHCSDWFVMVAATAPRSCPQPAKLRA